MKVNVSFNNVDKSNALKFFIQQKSENFKKLLWGGEHISWIIEQDSHQFKSIMRIKLKNKFINVSSKADNAFSSVNGVFDKAKRLIREDHRRLKLLH